MALKNTRLLFLFLSPLFLSASPAEVNEKVLLLNGTSDYVVIPDNNTLDITDGFTIDAWIKPCKTEGYIAIINKNWCAGGQASYHLGIRDGKLDFIWDDDGNCGEVNNYRSEAAVITAGKWSHVAVVHTLNSIQLWVNGKQVSGNFLTGKPGPVYSSNSPVLLGVYRNIDGDMDHYFEGAMDDIHIWKKPLNSSEIIAAYKGTANENDINLVASYKMDSQEIKGSLNTIYNSASSTINLNNGITLGGIDSPEITGQSLPVCKSIAKDNSVWMNGNDNFLTIPHNSTLLTPSELTLEAWIKPCKTKGYIPVINKNWCAGANASYHLGIRDGYLNFVWDDDGNCGEVNDFRSEEALIKPGEWTHIAVAHSASSVVLYINGSAVKGYFKSGRNSSIYSGTAPINIGTYRALNGEYTAFFQGRMDDVRIWNRTLSSSQIYNYSKTDLRGNEEGLVTFLDMEGISETGKGLLVLNKAASTGKINNAVTQGNLISPVFNNREEESCLKENKASALLNGKDSYFQIEDNSSVDLVSDLTLEAWIKPCNIDSSYAILSKNFCAGDESSYWFFTRQGKLSFTWNDDGNCRAANHFVSNEDVIKPGVWTHVAAVHTDTSVQLFVNGELVSGTFANGSNGPISISKSPVLLGTYKSYSGELGFFFPGRLDEIKVWNRSLSPGEIKSSSVTLLSGKEDGLIAYFDMEAMSTNGQGSVLENRATATGSVNNASASGKNGYPLYSTDNDGDPQVCESTTIVTQISSGTGEVLSIKAFPVPTENEVKIILSAIPESPVTVEVFDNNGKVVITKLISNTSLEITLSLAELPSGTYQCILKQGLAQQKVPLVRL